jgi:hypothetical protein
MDQGQCKAQGFGVPGGNMLQMAMVMIRACRVRAGICPKCNARCATERMLELGRPISVRIA